MHRLPERFARPEPGTWAEADQVALSGPLVSWLEHQGIGYSQPAIERTSPRIEPPGLEIGF
jgi:hypothetical protein